MNFLSHVDVVSLILECLVVLRLGSDFVVLMEFGLIGMNLT